MEKARWALFWLSVLLTVVGGIDRLLTPDPLIEGVAAGTYWKGAMVLVSYAIALSLFRLERSAPRP